MKGNGNDAQGFWDQFLKEKVIPPHDRPSNEAGGHLGYYTRRWLDEWFDLVDIDGCWPAAWFYRKSETDEFRFFEEKLSGQDLHKSQQRLFRAIIRRRWAGVHVYVIWEAERLSFDPPIFPIRLTRLGRYPDEDAQRQFDREEFDSWLLDGLSCPEEF